ncbi:cytochrome c nitrite reductase pentaheme subunit [Jinshanibacter sp. LJY008]|uniref:Cytochrome c nitrite reductase pentaheme subunit n=1 Tax=Limnobaculum eriocheiris TaxID=2897391 RepID=A0A9X1SK82_9GAMM|nr:cytochrome c nitrite reductase pentaheme subunit [Limnobaculum eriocheiris]MCD1125661.1 cytochrome c nitrite reductase pentaheme subunit [Limnobaculum eriocheiris]
MGSLRSLFKGGLLMLVSMFALTAMPSSAEPLPEQKTEVSSEYKVELQRNRDYACTQCHKDTKDGMHGAHSKAINPNNQLPVTCTNCHGKITPEHRNGVADAMRFNEDVFPVDKQNQVCMTCHQPEKLRTALWAHDVHILKTSCASCHQLHPAKDPVQGLDQKGQIKLCVDCHSKQQQQYQKEKETP